MAVSPRNTARTNIVPDCEWRPIIIANTPDMSSVERTRRQPTRTLAGQHVEEVRRVTEDRIRLNRSPARAHPPHRRDEGGNLCREADRLAVIGLRRLIGNVRIVMTER